MRQKLLNYLLIIILLLDLLVVTIPIIDAQEERGSYWWDTDWNYRKLITWNTSQIDDVLINFPCLLNITDSDLIGNTQTDGGDIAFIDYYDNTTQLNHEVEKYDYSTGLLWCWINDTIFSSTNNKIWMYYGNAGCSNQENIAGTWDTSYDAVYHLKDLTTSTVGDSTSNIFNGTKKAANEPLESTGEVYKSEYFDGVDDYITVNDAALLRPGTGDFTMEIWVLTPFPTTPAYWDGMFVKGCTASAPANTWGWFAYSGDDNRFTWNQATDAGGAWGASLSTTDLSAGWHYAVVQRSGTTVNLYVDGVYYSQDTSAGDNLSTNLPVVFGRSYNQGYYFDGYLDETRLTIGTARNSSYILTNYNNIVNSTDGGFFILGSQQLSGGLVVTDPSPTNDATDVELNPALSITVNHSIGDTMNITWSSNSSGSWIVFGINNSVTNGTFIQVNTNFSKYNTIFWWNISVDDGMGNWSNKTYFFTTKSLTTYVNIISPYSRTSSPLTVTGTGDSVLDNMSLYYRYSATNDTGYYFNSMSEADIDSGVYLNYPNSVDVADGYAFVAAYEADQILVYDVSDSEDIFYTDIAKENPYTYDAHAIVATHDSNYCYVLTTLGTCHLSVYNSTVKDSLSRVNAITLSIAENGYYLAISDDDNYLYVTTTSHLLIYNITNKYTGQLDLVNDTLVESGDTVCWLPTLYNDYVYIPSGVVSQTPNPSEYNGLYIYNVTDKTSPVLENIVNDSTMCTAACQVYTHSNGYTYLFYAGRTQLYQPSPYYPAISHIAVYNISANNESDPTFMYCINITEEFESNGTSGWGVFQNDYLYLNTNNWENTSSPDWQNGFFVYNFTDIDNPDFENRLYGKGSPTYLDYCHFFARDKGNTSDTTVYIVTQDDDAILTIVTVWDEIWGEYDWGYNEGWGLYQVDGSYPWSWSFNFPNGTGYYQFYSIGKKSGSTDETIPLAADTICHYSYSIVVSELDLVPIADYMISIDYPSSPTTHWDRLDEIIPDDSAGSYIIQYGASGDEGDIYDLQDHTNQTGFINKVVVHIRCRELSGEGSAWAVIRPSTINYTSSLFDLTTSYVTYNYSWSTNPDTGLPWSWGDIDNLRVGVNLSVIGSEVRCSQVYVTVNCSFVYVYTNESSNVEETNATVYGWLNKDNGTSQSAFFQYGLTTSYGSSTTKQYPLTENTSFSANLMGLSPGTVYHYRAAINDSVGNYNYGQNYYFTTKPEAPTVLTAATSNNTIYLSWTKGLGTTHTYIERNTSSGWNWGEATNIYNGTGSYYLDSGLSLGTTYFYQCWGFNSSISMFTDNITSVNNATYPNPPSSLSGVIYGTYLNISWTKGNGADTTLVRKKSGSYPTSTSDGTQCQNNTLSYWNETAVVGTYYSLWSYNTTLNVYSSQVNYTFGGLLINCYDVNTSLNITNWDIIISNSDGSEVYSSINNNNTLQIDISECPQGLDTVVISHENYSSAIYHMTIYNGNWYTLNAYLTHIDYSEIFVIQVIDDYNLPVSNALVTIKKYINTTGVFETVSSQYTDGYGEIEVFLLTSILHKVFIEKTGYTTLVADYIPDINIRTKIFKISLTTTTPPSYDTFSSVISFSNVMTGPGYMQLGNITTTYSDSNSSTTDTDIYIYSYYNGTYTLIASYHNTSNSFTIVTGGINTTRLHKVVLYFNNSADFIDVDSPFTVIVNSLYVYTSDTGQTKFNFDERVTPIVGPFTINGNVVPWGGVVAFGLGLAVLLLFGPFHVGLALIGCGLMTGFMDALFTIYLTDTFPVLLVTLAPIFVVLGVIYIMSKGGREHI